MPERAPETSLQDQATDVPATMRHDQPPRTGSTENMALTQREINQIAERWSASNWDDHEKAFARQWMTQAQEDVATLVHALREARDGAKSLWEAISKTVEDIEGDDDSHVGIEEKP